MKIVGIGIANFRSIGSDPVMVDLNKRVNLLIGANNSGKSNTLKLLNYLGTARLNQWMLGPTDHHFRNPAATLEVIVNAELTDPYHLPEKVSCFRLGLTPGNMLMLNSPFSSLAYTDLIPFFKNWLGVTFSDPPSKNQINDQVGQINRICVERIQNVIPQVHLIPEFRRITTGEYKIEGSGIAELLGQWKSPAIGKDEDRQRFHKVEEFLRELLGMPDIHLDVSRQENELLVERGKLRLPLTNYGTGIHQLIILAIAVLGHDDQLLGIEEPEIHLHTLLQKAFLRFLIEKTTNRYIITTHSNAFLSQPEHTQITHLWLKEGVTKSRSVETTAQMLAVLGDLGVRAADIMQANFVIWVEGPSDCIYIRHWLNLMAPEISEGIDYSMMFYGGRLLSHLSMERDDDAELSTDEFIKLLRINQHSAIVIDSDKVSKRSEINATKKRIAEECQRQGIICWVTEGREIENYVAPEAIEKTYQDLTGGHQAIPVGQFDKIEKVIEGAVTSKLKSAWVYENNKPALARRFIKHTSTIPKRFDLDERLKDLVEAIRAAK